MNTTLTEISQEEIEELRKDYYADYYPSPRIEKAIFNYLDQDYYASEDDVFYTIYKKENDFFVNQEEIQKEITKMFGLHLPERIKVGPNEDDYIQPARNPIPGRVIHKWIVKHQLNNFGIGQEDKEIAEDLEYWGVDGNKMGPIEEYEEIELSPEDKKTEIDRLETELDRDKQDLDTAEKELDRISSPEYVGTSVDIPKKDDEKKTTIGIGKDPGPFGKGKYFAFGQAKEKGDIALNMMYEQEKNSWKKWEPDYTMSDETKDKEKQIKKDFIDSKKKSIQDKEKKIRDLKAKPDTKTDSTGVMGGDDGTKPMDSGSTDDVFNLVAIRGDEDLKEENGDGAERLYKQHAHDNEDYVDNSPFTRKEILILKALHKNLTQDELQTVSEETPSSYGTGQKFWQVMKLFGIEYSNDVVDDTRSSIYAKWALDNWTEDGDYGSIEQPIKAPLKWYEIDRAETGSQIEYKDGTAEVLGFDGDDAGERADYDFYSWGGDMETTDYGDYESYDSQIDRTEFKRLDEQIDPELKYTIDQQYRTNPEMRDELLQSLEGEGDGKYYLNPEGTELNVPPIKIAQKFSDVNGYGNIKFDLQGGNGIAYFTDKGLVIKLTTDDSEYFTANKLVGTDNEYIVKVFESAVIKTSHTINDDLFVIVLEALPMTEEMEKTWSECCCGKDSPVSIDYLVEPVLVLPPMSDQDKCLPIYDNIVNIQKNFAQYDIVWSDIGIDNMGIKNGKLAVIDLGETIGGKTKGEEVTLNLENVKIRPLTKKQIQKQLVLI